MCASAQLNARGDGGHHHGERHIPASYVRAEVGRLPAVDRADQDHASGERRREAHGPGEEESHGGHEAVAHDEPKPDHAGPLKDAFEIVDRQRDAH